MELEETQAKFYLMQLPPVCFRMFPSSEWEFLCVSINRELKGLDTLHRWW